MAGGISIPARRAFADSLSEEETVKPLRCLDDGVTGYVFDLRPLYQSLTASDSPIAESSQPPRTNELIPLLQASLSSVAITKPRFVNSAQSPHEMLRLIQHVGIDMFDAYWAQRAADVGIALDFVFPTQGKHTNKGRNGKRDVGHNLYDACYAHDFSPLADCFRGRVSDREDLEVCDCAACSPVSPSTRISHSSVDENEGHEDVYQPPFTRAYIHHLLNTHEMSAHSLLAMHNLTVLDAMFSNVRSIITKSGDEAFAAAVDSFVQEYDETLVVFEEAVAMWRQVDLERGKGRLTRDKAQEDPN